MLYEIQPQSRSQNRRNGRDKEALQGYPDSRSTSGLKTIVVSTSEENPKEGSHSNRSTTLVIQNQETALFKIDVEVPQGSPLSPILFLFYNAALIEIGNQPQRSLLSIGFADDINLLTYGPSIQANCRKLERIHKDLLKWAQQHGMKFAPKKYKLSTSQGTVQNSTSRQESKSKEWKR